MDGPTDIDQRFDGTKAYFLRICLFRFEHDIGQRWDRPIRITRPPHKRECLVSPIRLLFFISLYFSSAFACRCFFFSLRSNSVRVDHLSGLRSFVVLFRGLRPSPNRLERCRYCINGEFELLLESFVMLQTVYCEENGRKEGMKERRKRQTYEHASERRTFSRRSSTSEELGLN